MVGKVKKFPPADLLGCRLRTPAQGKGLINLLGMGYALVFPVSYVF